MPSAAVPIAFVPIVLGSFPTACTTPLPPWVDRVLADRSAGAQVRAFAEALTRYRDSDKIRYLKLANGGITDNFGLFGACDCPGGRGEALYAAHARQGGANASLHLRGSPRRSRAIGRLGSHVEGPTGAELLNAVASTAINSSVRSRFDAFGLSIREWEEAIRKWRCSMPYAEARRLGASADWRCSNVRFEVAEIGIDLLGPQRVAKLSSIPTRFKLSTEQVDLLIQSGIDAVQIHPTFRVCDRPEIQLASAVISDT